MEEFTIFTESNEDMGLLFDGYKGIGEQVKSFLGIIEGKISELLKDPQHASADLREEITKFKAAVDKKPTPKPINISKVGATKAAVKNYRSDMEKVLDRYAKARDKMSFGGNLMRSIIMKPKVYSKEIDSESYAKNNRNIRNIERALDWVEKVLIDLFNLIDQDLNILTLVGKVYGKRKIYEHTEIFQSGDFDAYKGYTNLEDQDDDLLNESISPPEVNTINDLIKKIHTPDELLEWMNCIEYGWIDRSGKKCGTGEEENNDHMWAEYKLQSPLQLIRSKVGVCWDQCELERVWFNKQKYPFTIIYMEIDDDEGKPSHTFLIFKEPGETSEVKWFEHSWGQEKGIHKFTDLQQCLLTITQKFRASQSLPESPMTLNKLDKHPPYGTKVIPYMDFAHKQFSVDMGDLQYDDIFNESSFIEASDDPPPNMPTEGDENNGEGKEQSEGNREVSQTSDVPTEDAEVHDEPQEPEADQPKEEVKESMPKKTDQVESSKNGVRRKKLYVAFIEWAKEYNSKNTFGSIFDKDIFHNVYPFVPEEMRYFYRLANPILCVLSGDLTFFQVSELKKLNAENKEMDKLLIFAATPNDLRVFNKEDKRIYLATEADGKIMLGESIGDTFDLYIQKMIKKGDILNGPLDSESE